MKEKVSCLKKFTSLSLLMKMLVLKLKCVKDNYSN